MTVDENGLEVADALIDPITGSCARTGSAIVTPGCLAHHDRQGRTVPPSLRREFLAGTTFPLSGGRSG